MASRILVTGGLGFIGHNVVARLQYLGHDCMIYDNQTTYGVLPESEIAFVMGQRLKKLSSESKLYQQDITDTEAVDWLFKMHKFDTVIHLASFPRQKIVNQNPGLGSRCMSEALLYLLENSSRHQVQRFVYISSSMVYGNFPDGATEDYPCSPQGQYGIMKLAGEWLVRDYTRRTGMTHTIIRPSAVYGPLDVEDRVVSRFLLDAMHSDAVKVNGAHEVLDFSFVDDVANGIVAAVLSDRAENQTFNITRGHGRTLSDAAHIAVNVVGRGSVYLAERDMAYPSRGGLNIDRARELLGYNPQTDIEQGFKIYHDWLKNTIHRPAATVR